MFFTIPNLKSSVVTEIEKPWEARLGAGVPQGKAPKFKTAYSEWCLDPHTESVFICGYEGITKELRISAKEGNTPYRLHALIMDFDAPFDPVDDLARLKVATYSEFLPAYAIRTFSDRLRLVWFLESPVSVCSMEQAIAFQKLLVTKLSLKKWHAGLDNGALIQPGHHYHVGMEWYPLFPNKSIPASHVQLWLYEAAKKLSLAGDDQYDIPLDVVHAKVEEVYPGRWQGPFVDGVRGVVFWEPTATNQTAAMVRPDGMMYFSFGGGFKSWKQLFGQAFVEKYEADRLAKYVDKVAYDSRNWWMFRDATHWEDMDKGDFSQWLKVDGKVNSVKVKGVSKLDEMEVRLKELVRVHRVAPIVFYPPGRIKFEGRWHLNTCMVKVVEPSAPLVEGKMTYKDLAANAPFIWTLLQNLFIDENDPTIRDEPQLEYMLSWLKHAYTSGYTYTPVPGLAVFMMGPAGLGKTLFSALVVGGLLGGKKNASDHLYNGSRWTEDLAGTPLMMIDDGEATGDVQKHAMFTNSIKKYVANALMICEQKFKASSQIPWFGRILVTLNGDSQSRQILPNMDMSSKDKIMLFKCCKKGKMEFPPRAEISLVIKRELPVFARFLLDWEPPAHVDTSPKYRRFGMKAYHHPEILQDTMQQGTAGSMYELLGSFLPEYAKQHADQKYWVGTSTELMNDLAIKFPSLMHKWTLHGMTIALGVLASRGSDIARLRLSRDESSGVQRMVQWRIAYDIATRPAGSEDDVEEMMEESQDSVQETPVEEQR